MFGTDILDRDTDDDFIWDGAERTFFELQGFSLVDVRTGLRIADMDRDGLSDGGEAFEGTDCSSLVERLGIEVRSCPGSAENFKVTTPLDLERAEGILLRREGAR